MGSSHNLGNCPVNMPDLICILSGSGGKYWPEAGWILPHQLASEPDPLGQNSTQSAKTKSDPGWFCTILSGSCVDEQNRVQKLKTGSGPVTPCQKLGLVISAPAK